MSAATDPILGRMRADAEAIFRTGLSAADPAAAIRRLCRRTERELRIGERRFDLSGIDRIWVVGAGKATAFMAQAIEDIVGERIEDGIISVKYGHTAPLARIRTVEAGHPLPDANGVAASNAILELARQAGPRDLVIVLLSGGGSALMPLPAEGIGLAEKQATTDLLLSCGATIHEMNAIRKHLSGIKGGQLAQAAAPAPCVTLILSDVVGDDLDVIASGPTVPDGSTFGDCLDIIGRYGIESQLPSGVQQRIRGGAAGRVVETPKAKTHDWRHTAHLMVGSNRQALQAAAQAAEQRGYHTMMLSSCIEGETRTVARLHAAMAREILVSGNPLPPPACILSGGETTLVVKGDGRGGRNQEFALNVAMPIADRASVLILAAGTDGSDGPTDAAGAFVDHTTAARAAGAGLDIRRHLSHNDAYPFFKALGDLLITGPTGTNVMDLNIVLVMTTEKQPIFEDGAEGNHRPNAIRTDSTRTSG